MDDIQLDQFYTRLSNSKNNITIYERFDKFSGIFQAFCSYFGLSLRDIDYCTRLIVFIGKNATENNYMFLPLLPLLIILRLKNKTLYQEYIRGDRMGSEVMNYLDEVVPPENRDRKLGIIFDELEIVIYLVDRLKTENTSKSLDELRRLGNSLKAKEELPHTPYLSKRTQKSDTQRIENLISYMNNPWLGRDPYLYSKDIITHLSGLIELSQSFMRD